MKKFTLIVSCFFIISAAAYAQQPDTTQSKPTEKEKEKPAFVDRNGNGIDDRLEMKEQEKKKRHVRSKDRFIDRDGDGIADQREGDIMDRNSQQRQNRKRGGR